MRAYNVLTLLLATLAAFCWWRAGAALGVPGLNPATARDSFRLWFRLYAALVWLGFGAGLWALADALYLKRVRGTADARARAWLLLSPFLLWFLGAVGIALLADAWTRYRLLHRMGWEEGRLDPAQWLVIAVPVALLLAAANAATMRRLRRRSDQQARIENMKERARR